MKVLIKQFKESGLAPEIMLRTQRNCPFLELEKWLIFGILAKGGPHENFLGKLQFYKWLKVTKLLCKMRR